MKSKEFLKSAKGKSVYCPKLILAEILGVLVRYNVKLADVGYDFVLKNFNLIEEDVIFDEILKVCKSTGSRAVDGYFIATAKLTDSILITNDRIMASNVKKYGIEAYYLIEEFNRAINRIKELQQS
ncbi:PIN domain-containing protein [Ferroglobus placidus]|uniref:PIN domain-containing protein n=1 Tax=Ferroglobus placidus TaxID=54261 RepID=UPI00064E3750